MRAQSSLGVRWPIHLALISAALTVLACSDATAPAVATKYDVTTFNSTATVGDTIVVKAQLVDADDHPVHRSGKTVSWYSNGEGGSFSSSTSQTDADGIATNYFIVGTKAGTNYVIVVIDQDHLRGDATPITVMAGPPSAYVVTASSMTPSVGTTIALFAQLADKFGNHIADAGHAVSWSIANPDNGGYYYNRGVRTNRLQAPANPQRAAATDGTLSSTTSTTNVLGFATVDLTVGTSIDVSYIITATDGHASGVSAPITVNAGPIAKLVVMVSATDPPAGADVLLTAYLSDAYDNRISVIGTSVNWSVAGAGGTLSSTVTSTNQAGNATNTLTTGPAAGTTYTVTASSGTQATGTSPAITTLEQISLASLATTFGSSTSCGVATDGVAWCWGTQAGLSGRPLPGKPIGNQPVSTISSGGSFSCAIAAGTVICWGSDDAGQLGDNSRTSRTTAAPINSSLSFTAVSAGWAHTCAVSTSGEIYCWGDPRAGDLGDGTGFTGLGPIKVAGSTTYIAVTAGASHTCAIATSGDAYCWGSNTYGQLGNGLSANSPTPTLVSGGLKFTAIAAGQYHTCGIAAGTVYCWGDNTFGEVGNNRPSLSAKQPTGIKSTATFVAVTAGAFHSCAIASDATAYCWGDNSSGELGDLNFTQARADVPIAVTGGHAFKSIAAGGNGSIESDYYYGPYATGYSCGLTTDGVAYCWGANDSGQLGTGAFTVPNATPTKVVGQH